MWLNRTLACLTTRTRKDGFQSILIPRTGSSPYSGSVQSMIIFDPYICVQGEGGYFSTSEPWRVLVTPAGHNIYGDRDFLTREELRAHVAALPPAELGPAAPPAPVLHITNTPRIALVAHNGRQISHAYLQAVLADDIHYL